MKRPQIKTVEMLQISAALAASLRWAIALMPLDGKQFSLTSRDWYEPVSFALSMFFVVVEIGATAYIMRAWRRESNTKTRNGLMLLWVVALVMMTVTQVPPVIANMDGVSVGTFPLWLKVIYATCGVAVTFVVIGGVGYAEKSLETQAAPQVLDEDCHCPICYSVIGLPVWLSEQHGDKYLAYCDKCQRAYTESEVVWSQVGASVPQPVTPGLDKPAQPDSNLSMSSASGAQAWKPANLTPDSHSQADDSGHDATKSRQNATSSVFGEETASQVVEASSGAENADSQLDKPTAADVLLTFYRQNPTASMTKAALHVEEVLDREYSREAVRQQLKRLEAQGKIERNGQVIVK